MLSPLPSRTKYWGSADERQSAVTALFDRSAEHYDRACGILSFGSGRHYRRDALRRNGVQTAMQVLDVGTGTGLLAREIARVVGPSGRVIGIDPSVRMMTAGGCQPDVGVVQGLGEQLPFGSSRFDFVTMGYALRHVADLSETFSEYRRVLRPNGHVLLLEITKPASRLGAALARTYFGQVVPCLAAVGTGSTNAGRLMRFYWDTIEQCVAPSIVLSALRQAGFSAERTVRFGIFSEYIALRRD